MSEYVSDAALLVKSELHEAALEYAGRGLKIFPCSAGGKTPAIKGGFHAATADVEQINAWWSEDPNFNIGWALDANGCCAVDVEAAGLDAWQDLVFDIDHEPFDTRVNQTPSGGIHAIFAGALPSTARKLWPGVAIDTRGDKGYIVMPPSVVGGKPYVEIDSTEPAPLPAWISARIKAAAEARDTSDDVKLDDPGNVERARLRLKHYVEQRDVAVSGSGGNARTYALMCEMRDLGLSPTGALDLIEEVWNPHCTPPWSADELAVLMKHACDYKQNATGCDATAPAAEAFKHVALTETPPIEINDQVPPGSEIDLAQYIAKTFDGKLRYVAEWGQWLIFDGQRWRKDNTLAVWEIVKRKCGEFAMRAPNAKPAVQKALASKKTVAAVESLMRSERTVAATGDQWDADPWLLNTPGGVIDLRTGILRPARPEDYLTKTTAVTPGGACPQWLTFLDRITAGDRDLQAYLRRVFGYALTGLTNEHAMFFGHGGGGNGKGVLLGTISGIMADYALNAPIEVFTASEFSRHSTELARLQGARLVVSHETERGRRWAEARLKAITGGDPITARFMRQDDFTYIPQFKLFITGNHKPVLNVDEAMKRRLNLVPFTVTIPKGERDIGLADRLRGEWAGILAWGVEGCLEWQNGRLRAPQAVLAATESYFVEQDPFEAWFMAWCEVDDTSAWTGTTALYESYCGHCTRERHTALHQKAFVQFIEAKGFARREENRTTRRAGFAGLKLIEF